MAPIVSLRRGALTALAALALAGSAGPAAGAAVVDAPNPNIKGVIDTKPTYKIISVATGGHLVPDAWGNNRAEEARQWASVSSTNGDQWKFQDPRYASNGWVYYQIRNTTNNMCIKPSKAQVGTRTYLAQATCNDGASNQYWQVQRSPFNPGRVQFVNRSSKQAFQPWDKLAGDRWVSMASPAAGDLTWWSLTAV